MPLRRKHMKRLRRLLTRKQRNRQTLRGICRQPDKRQRIVARVRYDKDSQPSLVANLLFILNVLLLFFYFATFIFLLHHFWIFTSLLVDFYFTTFLSVPFCKSFSSGLQMFLSFAGFYVHAPWTYVQRHWTCVQRPWTCVQRLWTTFVTLQKYIFYSIPPNRQDGVRKKVLKTQIKAC